MELLSNISRVREYDDGIENLFPNLCKIHSLGTLNSGREILIAQISDNVDQKENEPSFIYFINAWR